MKRTTRHVAGRKPSTRRTAADTPPVTTYEGHQCLADLADGHLRISHVNQPVREIPYGAIETCETIALLRLSFFVVHLREHPPTAPQITGRNSFMLSKDADVGPFLTEARKRVDAATPILDFEPAPVPGRERKVRPPKDSPFLDWLQG